MLKSAPDKLLFLGNFFKRIYPSAWSEPLSGVFEYRKSKLITLAEQYGEEVIRWVEDAMPDLNRWIEKERGRDRAGEESFE